MRSLAPATVLSDLRIAGAEIACLVTRTLRMRSRRTAAVLLAAAAPLAFAAAQAQIATRTPDRITQQVDTTVTQVLPNHLPQWANSTNLIGAVPAEQTLGAMTIVLARSPQQEQAFRQFLAEQQDPASPNYHHWLTPTEIGDRYGLSTGDIAKVTGWLQSQGLKITWVAPSRNFIGFTGTAASVSKAFQTEVRYYNVKGVQHFAPSSDPLVPAALSPVIKAVRGLYTIEERPLHSRRPVVSDSPTATFSGTHYVTPGDFVTIYDLPGTVTGSGVTIGIVGESRTDFADFENFRSLTDTSFPNPTEVVPTAYGGVDPGPALTSPPSNPNDADDQGEATLDVMRSGSVAPGASTLLVVASANSGNIGADASYLVMTSPVPAQIMTISFGGCEYAAGSSGVQFWDSLFQQAAGEGISVFVASGDAGASGCDSYFVTPPTNPEPNSPNEICSSSYATCVGGTEFADTASPSTYWSSTNGAGYSSALRYIPEGAWNEPLNSSSAPQASATGGGVSKVIATPDWQTGTGVPTVRAGRYTPDISFTAAGHDGYLACFAAGGASCTGSNGEVEIFAGTSAAAPDMAGVAALLDQKLGAAQGNLNPELYKLVAADPASFHDVTVATSGVASCVVTTPSMCNNSIPGPTGLSGGQSGFLVNTGYDEATGLGSLDVGVFLNNFLSSSGTPASIAVVSGGGQTVTYGSTYANPLIVLVEDGNGSPVSGAVVSFSGTGLTFTGNPATTGSNGEASVTVKATSVGSSLTAAASVSGVTTPATFSLAATKAVLTVTANDASVPYNQPIPAFTYTITGYANGDPSSVVTGAPTETTTATQGSAVGSYPITIAAGTLSAADYSFTFVNGTLGITPSTAGYQFVAITPCRIADTRNATGAFGAPMLAANSTRTFNVPQSACNIPTTAVAYSLNVTVVPPALLNYLTMWPAGQAQPDVSTLNSDGRIKANAAITPAGTSGGVSIYASNATQVILDIDGYFVPAGTASALDFYPVTPCRVADTRQATGALGGPSLAAGTSRAFPVLSSSCGIPSTAKAYSLNVTAVPHTTLSYLTTWATGQAQPNASTLNSSTGAIAANAAIVPAGSSGDISVYVSDATDVILDVNGYFAPSGTSGLSFYKATPCRVLDTRSAGGAFDGTLAVAVQTSGCAPPSTAQAYVLNATVVPPAALTYLTLWAAGESQPYVSTLNAIDGATTSNMAIVPNQDGSVEAFSSNSTNLILDLSGYFAP